MGFNGVSNGGESMEIEDLFGEDDEMFWPLPEPSEEVKKLMGVYIQWSPLPEKNLMNGAPPGIIPLSLLCWEGGTMYTH